MKLLRRTALLDSLMLVCLVCVLIKPLFRLKYLDNWPSIESTFISDARILSDHLPNAAWQPLWYCGTRTDYIYPPALRYGTVFISRLGHVLPARAYHLYVAVFYVLGILAVYWLVRIGSASRPAALLAAAATALLSPSFLFIRQMRGDSAFLVPQRLHVLMAYGEGPHISALCVLPAALAAAFLALRAWRPVALAVAGALCALVVANNFYGATALAIFYPVMVWSVWVGEQKRGVFWRAAAIPLLAYGLSAFWLTPSYLKITLADLHWVSQPGDLTSQLILLFIAVVYGLVSLRIGRRRPERMWTIFACGAALIVSVWVLGFYYFGVRVSGEAARLVPELDLALILAAVEGCRALWLNTRWRIPVALLVVIAFLPSMRYVQHAWTPFPKAAPVESVYEYKTAQWVHDHLGGARVLPSGSVRLWFDAWSDNAQTDGGSMQGMLNQIIPVAVWQVLHGDRAQLTTLWLQALGTDAVVVAGKKSWEAYHDYEHEEKFRGSLPALYDDQHGTVVYGIPRVHPGIARVVDTAAMRSVGKIQGGADAVGLAKYVAVVENPASNPATMSWKGFDVAEIEAKTDRGQSVLVQETWDPAWHAWENGKALSVHPENTMGFMLIDTPDGDHRIQIRFETPLENRVGQILLALAAMVIIGLAVGQLITARRIGKTPGPHRDILEAD